MKIAFITLTNEGYLPYTFNCLKSLEKIGGPSLKCYAIGKVAYEQIGHKKYPVELIDDESNTAFQVFRTGRWADVTFYKFQIIYENLKNSDFVCFTDGDIVFKNPGFLDYCLSNIQKKDLLIQNDTLIDTSEENLCSGFMFIRSNKNTLDFFNPEYIKANADMIEGWGDQVYINQHKSRLYFGLLPLALFPNGSYHLANHETITPYLIHFNWVIGHGKIARIMKFKECYAHELIELYNSLKRPFHQSFILKLKRIVPPKLKSRVKKLLHG